MRRDGKWSVAPAASHCLLDLGTAATPGFVTPKPLEYTLAQGGFGIRVGIFYFETTVVGSQGSGGQRSEVGAVLPQTSQGRTSLTSSSF